jgi:Xaa-Pro dipeptidase
MPKRKARAEPKRIRPDDVDPHHDWTRPLQAPGRTQVDFEERVNFRRLHDYRLARVRAALATSGLGALLCFDQHNIRYTTSTVIGEWARDKLTRYSLLTGNGDPYIWDFGSAAKHHRLHAPWLHHDHCKAGLLGLRGATGSDITLFREAAREIRAILDEEGVGDMPLGLDVVEPPMMFELQKVGIDVRDGQQVMLAAREVKNIDELTLLNMAAAMVDGVYQDIYEALKPGVRESEIVALATARLYEMGSDCVEAINSISGERCSPHPHNFTDRLIRPGDQAFFDVIQSFMGYRTCYYRTFNVGRATPAQRTAYRKAREWMDKAIAVLKPGVSSDARRARAAQGAGHRLPERDGGVRPQLLPRAGARPARAAAGVAPDLAQGADRAQGRHGVRGRDLLPGDRRHLGRAHRGRGDPDAERREDHLAVPGRRAADANRY